MNTVYIVDDDKIVLDDFCAKRNLFLECGFEICGFETNPFDALKEIRAMRPDAVLSDLKMPGLTGIGLLEALSNSAFPPPLFVIVSAYGDFKDVRDFFSLHHGFDYILKPVTDQSLSDLLIRLFSKLNKPPPVAVTKTPSRKLNMILEYLEEYSAMNHTLEGIGALFSVNPNTVCNLFAKHMNTTFISHLTKLRLKRAAELLLTTDMTVKDVSINCGYTNYFYFTRVFSKTYGKPPSVYRESAKSYPIISKNDDE